MTFTEGALENTRTGALTLAQAFLSMASEEEPLSVKGIKQIGPYEIEKKLGNGAFATVKAAVHLPTSERVCVRDVTGVICVEYDVSRA